MVSIGSLESMLRSALNHLYDPTFLRDSPLIGLLRLEGRANTAVVLCDALEKAIEALRGDQHPTMALRNQRYAEILFYRYVQQFTQMQVADQLGVSPRHLRREQTSAIRALAEYLREHYTLNDDPTLPPILYSAQVASSESADVDKEIMWLEDSLADGVADVDIVLREALQTAQSLAQAYRVHLGIGANTALPRVAVAPTVLKQIVLNLVTTLIAVAAGGTVALTTKTKQDRVSIDLTGGLSPANPHRADAWDHAKVNMSRRLAKLCAGEVTIAQDADLLTFSVSIPSIEQIHVLAIEDNEDTLQLWRRYVENTRFHLAGVREPQHAVGVAREQKPDLIVLDIMMPSMDGWELLTQLHHHPLTSHIPIIVCTVLPQKELAFSLGASGFMCKPTTRQSFLDVLKRQSEALGHRS